MSPHLSALNVTICNFTSRNRKHKRNENVLKMGCPVSFYPFQVVHCYPFTIDRVKGVIRFQGERLRAMREGAEPIRTIPKSLEVK